MPKSLLDYVVGDLGEKRAYRRFVKRVNALPKDYRCAFKKIRRYMFNFGGDGCRMEILTDLSLSEGINHGLTAAVKN